MRKTQRVLRQLMLFLLTTSPLPTNNFLTSVNKLMAFGAYLHDQRRKFVSVLGKFHPSLCYRSLHDYKKKILDDFTEWRLIFKLLFKKILVQAGGLYQRCIQRRPKKSKKNLLS